MCVIILAMSGDKMTWSFQQFASSATHLETKVVFDIEYARNIQSASDITMRQRDASSKRFTPAELAKLKDELWAHHLSERRRGDMRRLIENDFSGDRHVVADVISQLTARKVSARTVQAWLIEPGRPSSRQCPEWAVKALLDYKSIPDNAEALRARQEFESTRPMPPERTAFDVLDKHAVRSATDEIESDRRNREAWRKASLTELPDRIFELQKRTESALATLQNVLGTMSAALKMGESFDDFRTKACNSIRDWESGRFYVSEARRAIESGTDEFANDEGVLKG